MKKALFLAMTFSIFLFVGCARHGDFRTDEMKSRDALKSFYIIKSNDDQVGITIHAQSRDSIDGVSVEIARDLTAAVYKEIIANSSRFSAPDELPRETMNAARLLPHKFITLSYAIKDNKKFAFSRPSMWMLNGEKLNESYYYNNIELNFNCTGDSEQVCTRKMTDASVQALSPIIKKFITEQGY
jgi:hypothetical protein